MADNLSHRGGRDRERININQDHELRYWSTKLGISADELIQTVRAVGDNVDKVEEHVRRQFSEKAGSRSAGAPQSRAEHAGSGNSLGNGQSTTREGKGRKRTDDRAQ